MLALKSAVITLFTRNTMDDTRITWLKKFKIKKIKNSPQAKAHKVLAAKSLKVRLQSKKKATTRKNSC